jgi:hypothetical protein
MRTLPRNKCGKKFNAISLHQNAVYYDHNAKKELFITLIRSRGNVSVIK